MRESMKTIRDMESGATLVIDDSGRRIEVKGGANLECCWRDCRKQHVMLVRTGGRRWSTRCHEHVQAHEAY